MAMHLWQPWHASLLQRMGKKSGWDLPMRCAQKGHKVRLWKSMVVLILALSLTLPLLVLLESSVPMKLRLRHVLLLVEQR